MKKIKGVGFDACDLVRHEDSRASFKYQTLLQDYHELQKEIESARSKIEAMKLKKLTLHAEVQFLKRRRKFLLKNKSSTPKKPAIINSGFVEATRNRKTTNEKIYLKKKADHKRKAYGKKKNALLGIPTRMLHGAMEQFHRRATEASDLNQTVKINSFDVVDSNKDTTVKTRVPTFDLNKISREEEEELQEGYEPNNLVTSVHDDKVKELKLSMCRNIIKDASTSQGRKRKISWQDHVVLQV